MANGQRVPEDLHPINLDYMLHRALKPVEEKTPFTLCDLDFPVMMAAEGSPQNIVKRISPETRPAGSLGTGGGVSSGVLLAGAAGKEASCAF